MGKILRMVCEDECSRMVSEIERLAAKGWHVVNAFYRAGKVYSWYTLMVKED